MTTNQDKCIICHKVIENKAEAILHLTQKKSKRIFYELFKDGLHIVRKSD